VRPRHHAVDIHDHARARAPADLRRQRGRVDRDFAVEFRAGIALQRLPEGDGLVQRRAARGVGLVAGGDVLERRFVGGDHAGARAGFDGHVADRHAAGHVERPDGLAGIFQHAARAARRADLADQAQDEILGADPFAGPARERRPHRAASALPQRLRGQHVLDLAGADAERQRPERAVRGRVGVAADDRQPRQGQAQLRRHDVHDARGGVADAEQLQAEFRAVLLERVDLRLRDPVHDVLGIDRRDVVVDGRHVQLGTAHLAPRQPQPVERLRARHFMDELAVHVQQRRTVRFLADHVPRPDFVVEGCAHKTPDYTVRPRPAQACASSNPVDVRPPFP